MKSQRCEVTATELDEAGLGVGLSAGRRIHVTDLLPGEHAEVAIDHASPHKPEGWGRIVRRLGPTSPERVEPKCPGWGRCGGCVWQHLSYPAQLEAKHTRVAHALAHVRGGVPVGPVRPSPALFGYRNKGKYVVGLAGKHLVLGAYAPRTHAVVDTLGCRVVEPIIDELASWIRGAAEAAGLVPYDEKARTGELRYVILREAKGDVMAALVVATGTPRTKLEQVANALSRHPAMRGLVAITNDRRDGAIVPSGSSAQVLFGHGHIVEEIAGVSIALGAAEFLQVNRAQATAMYARVAELALDPGPRSESGSLHDRAGGTHALDLFAGLGGIGLHLARGGATVTSVELDREAVAQLRRAAERANLPLHAIAGDAGELSRDELGDPDVVVVNPPRKGLSDGARALLSQLAPPTILYVSCGPESLGRDIAALRDYRVDVIEPFDLMPGTPQVETVVRLRRRTPAG